MPIVGKFRSVAAFFVALCAINCLFCPSPRLGVAEAFSLGGLFGAAATTADRADSFAAPSDAEADLRTKANIVFPQQVQTLVDGTVLDGAGGSPSSTPSNEGNRSADVVFNFAKRNRLHPQIAPIRGGRTTACAGKFISLSSRSLDMYWDDGRGGVPQGTLRANSESTTNSYVGHVFYFTEKGNKANEVARVTIEDGKTFYAIEDPAFPGDPALIQRVQAEQAFCDAYFNRTGIRYRHYFGPEGPRPAPVLAMLPAAEVGDVHKITSYNGVWSCDGPASECLDRSPLDIEVEVISTAPRAFIIDRFLSDFETDAIIGMAKDKVERSSVGNSDDDGGRMSDTRTSRNTWLARNRSPVLDTIARRAADTLMLDEAILVGSRNAEHMQVVHYVDGQRYDSHHDWGVSGRPESRYITMLFYLNNQSDVHAGGETSFPKAQGVGGSGIKVRPVKGSSIIFYNLLPDGNGDDLALHAALPVSRGEKWLANYWIWDPVKNK